MKSQQERKKSSESIKNGNDSQQSINQKDDIDVIVTEQTGGIQSQTCLGQNQTLGMPSNQMNNQAEGIGINHGGGQLNLSKTKSKNMIHNGSNLQGYCYNTSSNLFLTSHGNNNIIGSSTNINFFDGQYKHIDQFPNIQQAYGQLNNLVEILEEKVDGVIERHEAEFLLAYKNHMVKIRKELLEMKHRMDEQDKKLKAGHQMDQLEKQLAWFRDESLKLYEKLGQKDKQIGDFKHIVADQKKELSFQEGQITQLKKKMRLLVKKVSGTMDNFNPDMRSASSVSAQIQLLQNNFNENGQNGNYTTGISYNNSFSVQPQGSSNQFSRGKGSSLQSFVQSGGSKRPVSSEYSYSSGMYQNNTQVIGGNNIGSSGNVNNLNNSNIYLSGLNPNNSNIVNDLLGDVAEQNETQNSQGNNEDFSSNNIHNLRSTKYSQAENKLDEWTPQSEFIAEMVVKYQNDHLAIVREITHMFKVEDEKKQKQIKQLKERLDKLLKQKLTQNVVRSDLENFFLECIETVRKQIIKRKPPQKNGEHKLNFYLNQIKDYSTFRNEDKIKILELLLSNERLMMFVYQKIFPQNFNKLMDQAVSQTHIQNVNSQNEQFDISKVDQSEKSKYKEEANRRNIDTENLVKMVEEIGMSQIQEQLNDSEHGTTPANKLSINYQLEKINRAPNREFESLDAKTVGFSNRITNRQRPLTQQNQFGSRSINYSSDEHNLNHSLQIGSNYNNNYKKQNNNNSFSIDPPSKSISQISYYQQNPIRKKLNNLVSNGINNINQSNRLQFQLKKNSYQAY